MNKGVFISIVSVLLVIIITGIIFTLRENPSLSPSSQNLEECKSAHYSGENGINIVFFSGSQTAKMYADKLLSISPFSENKEALNFYYIDRYEPECELYKDIALLCYSRELIKKASSCPNDYVVVVKDADTNIRSSAYMNVVSINSKLPLNVFAHEFGHVFANLADEYSPSNIPKDSENCASDCSRFGENSECFQGCSEQNYYRSINLGIMRTLSSAVFGKFNEGLIAKIILEQRGAITANAVSDGQDCANEEYYLIEGNYSGGEIKFISKTIEQGCIGSNGAGSFSYAVILEDDSRRIEGEFNAELIFTDVQNSEESLEGGASESEGAFLLKIPVIENAKSLELSTESSAVIVPLGNKGDYPCEIQ